MDKNKNEMRGIYNVTFNDKQYATILRDIETIENVVIEYIAMYIKGYHNEKKDIGLGAEHIKLHLKKGSQGEITIEELINIGHSLRAYLKQFKEPFIDDKGGKVFEWANENGTRFRVVADKRRVGVRDTTVSQTRTLTNQGTNATSIADVIITFYSDRNLNKQMEFKNPKVEEYYQQQKVLQNPTSSKKNIFSKNPKPTQETREKLAQKAKEISSKSKIDKTCHNKSNDKDR